MKGAVARRRSCVSAPPISPAKPHGEESMMLTLYHHPTAVCAAKVRMVLAEKQLSWDGRIVDLGKGEQRRPEYLALNPNGVINTLTSVMVFCPLQRTRTAEEQAEWTAHMPDIAKRQKWIELMRDGAEALAVRLALVRLQDLIRDMESALANGPWLVGDAFTLADSGLISFFARLNSLSLDFLPGDYSRVADWYMRCVARPSFDVAIGQFRSDPMQTMIAAFGKQSQASILAAGMGATTHTA